MRPPESAPSELGKGSAAKAERSIGAHATIDEVRTMTVRCRGTAPAAHITGTVSDLAAGQTAQIALGGQYRSVSQASPSYELTAWAGTTDAVVTRSESFLPLQVLLSRGIQPTDGAVLDFDLASAVTLESHTLTIEGQTGAETVFRSLSFRTARDAAYSTGADPWPGVPATSLQPADMHFVGAQADDSLAKTTRRVTRVVHAPADLTLTFAALAPAPSVSAVATTPYIRLSATVSRVAGAQLHVLRMAPSPGAVFWSAFATDGWMAAGGANAVTMADLDGLTGWQSSWALETGRDYEWYVDTFTSNRDVAQLLSTVLYDPPTPSLEGFEATSSSHGGLIHP